MNPRLVELIFKESSVPPNAKLTALFIARYCFSGGQPIARPNATQIAERLGSTRQTIQRSLRILKERGLLIKATVNGMRCFLFIGRWA